MNPRAHQEPSLCSMRRSRPWSGDERSVLIGELGRSPNRHPPSVAKERQGPDFHSQYRSQIRSTALVMMESAGLCASLPCRRAHMCSAQEPLRHSTLPHTQRASTDTDSFPNQETARSNPSRFDSGTPSPDAPIHHSDRAVCRSSPPLLSPS